MSLVWVKTCVSNNVYVSISFYLLSINELNEVTETLKTTGYLWIVWHDDFLVWNASEYGGLYFYYWPQDDVWKPDIALKNSYTEYKELGVKSLNVMVYSSGQIYWYPFQVFQSTCGMDITYYPYDIQTCNMVFVAWSYSKDEINILSGDKGIDLYEYESNSEWEVLDTAYNAQTLTYEAQITFTIQLQRKPTYVLLSVIMPIIMLAILNIAVFLLPCESGEKSGYAVTVFLAFAVFLSILSSTLPENSDSIAAFSLYLIILTLMSTTITLIALVLIRLASYDNDNKPVPKALITFLDICMFKKCRKETTIVEPIKSDEEHAGKEMTDDGRSVKSDTEMTWRYVVNTFDFLFFILYSTILILSTVIFFGIVASHKPSHI
ncbi:Neurotransmitter-gated ion-channel transmembrane region [Mactra antiquata]